MSDIHTETITYEAGGTELKGYLAYDSQVGVRPGVLVVHEWWGLNDYIRRRAHMLAALGFTAFAADMYGDGAVADNPGAAGELMNSVLGEMTTTGEARLRAAVSVLSSLPETEGRVAAIGYCFGGAVVLHGARIGMGLRGVVSFHGSLGSFHAPQPGDVKAKVLVCHGAADSLVPDSDVEAFKQEMAAADVDYRFNAYPQALHGFTNPDADANGEKYGLPLAYEGIADAQSWSDMRSFFEEVL